MVLSASAVSYLAFLELFNSSGSEDSASSLVARSNINDSDLKGGGAIADATKIRT